MRKVRQRDGFGCVFCGYPLVRYHHIIHHSNGGPDTTENLVTLCSNCHDEVHAGLLTEDDLQDAIRQPAAFRKEIARTRIIRPRKLSIKMGNQVFGASKALMGSGFAPFSILGHCPLRMRFEDGVPLVSMELRANDGSLALQLIDNEIIQKADMYDIEWQGGQIKVRAANRLVIFRAEIGDIFDVKEAVFVLGEHIVWVSQEFLYLNTLSILNNVHFMDYPVGYGIGHDGFCSIGDAPTYFDYQDTVDTIRGEKIPVNLEKLRRVVEYYGISKSKTEPTREDEDLYLKFVMPVYEKRPDWLKHLPLPTSIRPKYRDIKSTKPRQASVGWVPTHS